MITHSPTTLADAAVARPAAAALALLGATAAVPLGLAQLDLGGLVDVFSISADLPRGITVATAVGGCLTLATIVIALAGALLAAIGSPRARPVLRATAIAGFATALMLWLPHALALWASSELLGRAPDPRR